MCVHQVVLTISQMMWCKEMDDCLDGNRNHFASLQEFEQTNFDVNHNQLTPLAFLSPQINHSRLLQLPFFNLKVLKRRARVCCVFQRLNVLAAMVRGQLPTLHRNIITALITIDVHARDIVTNLVRKKVRRYKHTWKPSIGSHQCLSLGFEWLLEV